MMWYISLDISKVAAIHTHQMSGLLWHHGPFLCQKLGQQPSAIQNYTFFSFSSGHFLPWWCSHTGVRRCNIWLHEPQLLIKSLWTVPMLPLSTERCDPEIAVSTHNQVIGHGGYALVVLEHLHHWQVVRKHSGSERGCSNSAAESELLSGFIMRLAPVLLGLRKTCWGTYPTRSLATSLHTRVGQVCRAVSKKVYCITVLWSSVRSQLSVHVLSKQTHDPGNNCKDYTPVHTPNSLVIIPFTMLYDSSSYPLFLFLYISFISPFSSLAI